MSENPLENLLSILGFEIGEQNWLPLFHNGKSTEHILSIFPEYSHTAKMYGEDLLVFNCSIQRDGVNHHFVEFIDEIEFYNFMKTYDTNKNYKEEEFLNMFYKRQKDEQTN